MKKTVLASMMMVFSLGAIAEQGGFEGGKTPPPQKQQDAGYKGSEDTGQTHIEQIRNFRQGGYVTLEGYIVKKLNGDNYQFRDRTGTVTIKATADTFKGKTYNAEDQVRVSGKVYGRGENTRVDVARIEEP